MTTLADSLREVRSLLQVMPCRQYHCGDLCLRCQAIAKLPDPEWANRIEAQCDGLRLSLKIAASHDQRIQRIIDLEEELGRRGAALAEIQKMSHTDRCDVPHYKDGEVQCTCHIHIVENALAKLEGKP